MTAVLSPGRRFSLSRLTAAALATVCASTLRAEHSLSTSGSPRVTPSPAVTAQAPLDVAQSAAFRAWFVAIVNDQITRAPTPRWVHRDCAGLVRFAASEALRRHDERWLHAMGWDRSRPRPPELDLQATQADLGRTWQLPGGSTGAYAAALALVQSNTRPIGRARTHAQAGDLLFFDQGDDQHLMVWTGSAVAYHTGADPTDTDNGLRRLRWERLLAWPDTRWRPTVDNPNFAGLHRFSFLT